MDDNIQWRTMLGGQDPEKGRIAYEEVANAATEKMYGAMCWPMEWFPEHMPPENAPGSTTQYYLERMANPLCTMSDWPKPDMSEIWKEDVLIFSDSYGYCKEIVEQAPPGRIGILNVQSKPIKTYTEKDVKNLVTMHPWDVIIFAVGIDPPKSNDVEDLHDHQMDVVMLYLQILKRLGDDPSRCKHLVVLTCDTFAEEEEIHRETGISLICNATLFGMSNTARQEIQSTIQYIDTEWALRTENTKYIVAEIFRHQSFGHNTVRILNKGRYVLRMMHSAPYEHMPEWQVPDEGIIAITGGNGALGLVMGIWLLGKAKEQGGKKIEIQFLSRSCKINDQNMPNWKIVQEMAAELGIVVEQKRCDGGDKEEIEKYIQSVTPNLVGFIHSAGVLADAMLANQSREKFDISYQAKSRAALYVHDFLQKYENPKLHFVWWFSSGAVFGNMGQLNYSSSNSFLDALCRHRRALGQPCAAPQWGAWGEVGMAVNLDDASRRRMANSPMPYFSNAEGLYGLECGLRSNLPNWSVFKINPSLFFMMVSGDDTPMQCYMRHFYTTMMPPPPGDPYKNHYTTIAYENREETHFLPNGLVFQTYWPKLAEDMLYYGRDILF